MARDRRAEYARRNAKAREAGWKSYGQQRRAHETVEASDTWAYYNTNGYIPDTREGRDEAAKALYMMRGEKDTDYGHDSWHFYFFVEVLGYMTAEEWDAHYPNGARTYGIHR